MSQITRCPSCATSFKIVADQLRISEGWVRCGQCKEVFDASAHLLPVAAPSLLPDVSLTDARPPSIPLARKADAVQVWGGRASAPSPSPSVSAQRSGVAAGGLPDSPDLPLSGAGPRYTETLSPPSPAVPAPVLAVPSATVPAFLSVAGDEGAAGTDGLSLVPATPFSWRSPAPAAPEAPGALVHTSAPAPAPAPVAPEIVPSIPSVSVKVPQEGAAYSAFDEPLPESLVKRGLEKAGVGYELPFADLRDAAWSADAVAPEAGPSDVDPANIHPSPVIPAVRPSPTPPSGVEPLSAASHAESPSDPLPSVDFVRPLREEAPAVLALVEDDSPAAVLHAGSRKVSREAADVEVPEDEAHDADREVSFVVAARRKAFWRKPFVRFVLVLTVLLCLSALALQVIVQERDRIVALDARARPLLLKLCGPLQCEIAPQRQIADLVIDSSSFNKARGDSYQLAFTMKSKAAIPLAMPAVELTLTDSQDQPVLRRVLLPADMAAPSELSARGEWSTSVSVIVTTGGARVAGYRLLAFYP